MSGDVGFERKLVQHGLAKGVYGLDFQAAGRFERPREQLPRQRKAHRIRLFPFQIGNRLDQSGRLP